MSAAEALLLMHSCLPKVGGRGTPANVGFTACSLGPSLVAEGAEVNQKARTAKLSYTLAFKALGPAGLPLSTTICPYCHPCGSQDHFFVVMMADFYSRLFDGIGLYYKKPTAD